MEKITAIIVDDELAARHLLSQMLQEQFAQVHVLSECKDLLEGVAAIKQLKPDVVFLDIEMPHHSGLEIMNFFEGNTLDFEIVFVTAYSEYALKAFELAAIDYILKPIDTEQLERAIQRLQGNKHLKTAAEQIHILKNSLQNAIPSRVCISTSEGKYFFNPDELIYFEADGSYTQIFSTSKKVYVSKNIKYFEEMLSAHPDFMRVHRSYLINLKSVLKYQNSNTVQLNNGAVIQISNDKLQDFLKRMK